MIPMNNAFLAEIRAHPDDDEPRLIYADWLEEQGDPRGEFIRLSCERANLDPWDERYDELDQRVEKLWQAHFEQWQAALPNWKGIEWECHGYVRSLIECIELNSVAAFRRHGNELFDLECIQGIRTPNCTHRSDRNFLLELLNAPAFDRLRMLTLTDVSASELTALAGAKTLLESPYLNNLRRLDVGHNDYDDAYYDLLKARYPASFW